MSSQRLLFLSFLLAHHVESKVARSEFFNDNRDHAYEQTSTNQNSDIDVGKRIVPSHPPFYIKIQNDKCNVDSADCRPVQGFFDTCLGTKLPYSFTGGPFLEVAHERLEIYSRLEGLPGCWESLREVLCAVFLPACNYSRRRLASAELCLKAMESCSFLRRYNLWPKEIGDCTNASLFAYKCQKSDVMRLRWFYDKEEGCVSPLVRSSYEHGWMFGIKQCSVNCSSPFLTSVEHGNVNRFKQWFIPLVLGMILFSLLTFSVAGHSLTLTLKMLQWIFVYYAIICICYMLPIFGVNISCRSDGSMRLNEPTSDGEDYFCLFQFASVYFSMFLSNIWVLLYMVAHHTSHRLSEKEFQKLFDRYYSYCHSTFSLPLVLAVCILSMAKVDTDGISGICFVGYTSPYMMLLFVDVPLFLVLLCCFVLFVVDCIKKPTSFSEDTETTVGGISVAFRLCVYISSLLITNVGSCWLHSQEYIIKFDERRQSLKEFILCRLSEEDDSNCQISGRDARLVQLELILLFAPPMFTFLYIWSCDVFSVWKRVWLSYSNSVPSNTMNLNAELQMMSHHRDTDADDAESKRNSLCSSIETSLTDVHLGSTGVQGNEKDHGGRSKRRDFMRRLRQPNLRSMKHGRGLSQSHSSLRSLDSIGKPPSSANSLLPSEVSFPSTTDLGFPDESRYPIIDPATLQSWYIQANRAFASMMSFYFPYGGFVPPVSGNAPGASSMSDPSSAPASENKDELKKSLTTLSTAPLLVPTATPDATRSSDNAGYASGGGAERPFPQSFTPGFGVPFYCPIQGWPASPWHLKFAPPVNSSANDRACSDVKGVPETENASNVDETSEYESSAEDSVVDEEEQMLIMEQIRLYDLEAAKHGDDEKNLGNM